MTGIHFVQIFGALDQSDSQLIPGYASSSNAGRRLSQSSPDTNDSPALSPQMSVSHSLQYISAGSPELYSAELEFSKPLNGTMTVR